MAWDEWEQIKTEAAARGSARTDLEQLPSDEPGGTPAGAVSGELRSDKRAWVTAGEGVTGLKSGIGKALTTLEEGQAGLGDPAGCRSAAAQKELYESWKKYAGEVRRRCEALGGLLERAGHDLSKSDAAVKEELDGLTARYRDTAPVGGQTKGK
ncbi:hypothetical protein DDQ41_18880 [Streptomyces spongiicola]|uniref:Amino acid ABC transporter permease n=1 Tax=Streptomyces spongiicola TaxID=1690221 RepID=A0ABM6V8Y8_9ACTN|nr:hypothetical protein [Streptomyces spongiicola]AWK10619.1 hypothetical protein DDQ41_18880 [Streptomyces spongiicola]